MPPPPVRFTSVVSISHFDKQIPRKRGRQTRRGKRLESDGKKEGNVHRGGLVYLENWIRVERFVTAINSREEIPRTLSGAADSSFFSELRDSARKIPCAKPWRSMGLHVIRCVISGISFFVGRGDWSRDAVCNGEEHGIGVEAERRLLAEAASREGTRDEGGILSRTLFFSILDPHPRVFPGSN